MWTVTKNRKNRKNQKIQKNVPKILEILENFKNISHLRRRIAGENPSHCEFFFVKSAHLRRRSDIANAAHLRKIRGAKSSQMRLKCAKFRLKIRICDAFSPYLRRVFALRIFANSSQCDAFSPAMRRRKCAGDSPSHLRIFANFSLCDRIFAQKTKNLQINVFQKMAKIRPTCEFLRIFRKCDVFSP